MAHPGTARSTSAMGTAEDLAQALGVDVDTVRRESAEGRLITVLSSDCEPDQIYPMFQAWPGIAGKPLERVLEALGQATGPEAYHFMTAVTDFLGGLTPIEALMGQAPADAPLEASAKALLKQGDEARLSVVVDLARDPVSIV